MFVGIEETTDSRYPETVIKKFRSERAAVRWMTEEGANGYAWSGAATHDVPGYQQNWHHRLRCVYEIKARYQPPKKEVNSIVGFWRGTSRYVTIATAEGELYRKHAVRRVELPKEVTHD